MPQVILYTTPTCTYCRSAKAFFEEHGVDYEEIDVSQDVQKAQELIEKTGQTGVPVIEIDGEVIIGFDKRRIAKALGLE